MSDDWLVRLIRLFGRPAPPPATGQTDLEQIDERLGAVEGELREVDVRLHLLERQADPRGIRGGDRDRP